MGPQEQIVTQVKRVLGTPCGMVPAHVQPLEVELVALHLSPLHDLEPHAEEDAFHLLERPGEDMPTTQPYPPAGKRDIEHFGLRSNGLELLAERGLLLAVVLREFPLQCIEPLPHPFALVRGERRQLSKKLGQDPLAAQVSPLDLVEVVDAPRSLNGSHGFLVNSLQLLHRGHVYLSK